MSSAAAAAAGAASSKRPRSPPRSHPPHPPIRAPAPNIPFAVRLRSALDGSIGVGTRFRLVSDLLSLVIEYSFEPQIVFSVPSFSGVRGSRQTTFRLFKWNGRSGSPATAVVYTRAPARAPDPVRPKPKSDPSKPPPPPPPHPAADFESVALHFAGNRILICGGAKVDVLDPYTWQMEHRVTADGTSLSGGGWFPQRVDYGEWQGSDRLNAGGRIGHAVCITTSTPDNDSKYSRGGSGSGSGSGVGGGGDRLWYCGGYEQRAALENADQSVMSISVSGEGEDRVWRVHDPLPVSVRYHRAIGVTLTVPAVRGGDFSASAGGGATSNEDGNSSGGGGGGDESDSDGSGGGGGGGGSGESGADEFARMRKRRRVMSVVRGSVALRASVIDSDSDMDVRALSPTAAAAAASAAATSGGSESARLYRYVFTAGGEAFGSRQFESESVYNRALKMIDIHNPRHCYRFDRQLQRWERIASLNVGRIHHAMCVHRGVMYVSGGERITQTGAHVSNLTVLTNTVEAYPLTRFTAADEDGKQFIQSDAGRWRLCAPMIYARRYHSMCVLGGVMYAIGHTPVIRGRDHAKVMNEGIPIETYDFSTDKWSIVDAPIQTFGASYATVIM